MFLKLGNSRSGAFFWRIFSGVGQVDLLEEDEGDREILSSVAGRVFHAEEPVWTTD